MRKDDCYMAENRKIWLASPHMSDEVMKYNMYKKHSIQTG
jgi:hypothetical protein